MPTRRRGSKKPARKSAAAGRPKLRYAGEMRLSWIPAFLKQLGDPQMARLFWSQARIGEKFYLANTTKEERKTQPFPSFGVLAGIGMYAPGGSYDRNGVAIGTTAKDKVEMYILMGPPDRR